VFAFRGGVLVYFGWITAQRGPLALLAAASVLLLRVIYLVFRVRYLKSKGRDLMRDLKTPYQPWEAREAECLALDRQA